MHLCGEEYPADDLGARNLILKLIESRTDIVGLLLMDMIGWRNVTDPRWLFQVNAGNSDESIALGRMY